MTVTKRVAQELAWALVIGILTATMLADLTALVERVLR